ncbi:hypothetical protein K8R42_04300 [bacterium]|nr:hypothetical protein [bacterium]
MKKSSKWLIVIIIAVFLAIVWYVASTKWLDLDRETYKNTRYGFSLKYPAAWTLGEPETNNAGRTISSPDEKVFCYAYGFANALVEADGEPQSLSEFIDWLINADSNSDIVEVVQREDSIVSRKPIISLLIEQDTGYKKAIYALGNETGIGFFCTYPDEAALNEYADEYGQMIMSFKITANLDGEVAIIGTEECDNLVNGVIIPFKDFQQFTDTNYTEVTITSRNAWDKQKLPSKVIQLENQGYTCYPMPLEFDDSASDGGVYAEPAVTKVEWQCELEYDVYQYLSNDQASQKKILENQGYTCGKEECLTDSADSDFVWLCTK